MRINGTKRGKMSADDLQIWFVSISNRNDINDDDDGGGFVVDFWKIDCELVLLCAQIDKCKFTRRSKRKFIAFGKNDFLMLAKNASIAHKRFRSA